MARMSDARHVTLALLAPAAVVAVAIAILPRFSASIEVAAALTFGGAALVAVLGVALGARQSIGPRTVAAVDAFALIALVVVALLRVRSPWIAALVDTLLIAVAWATGGLIGERVEHPSHLLPAAAVAAAADVASVASSWGPSAAIASSERALSVLAISFPVIGTHAIAPALGVGDLVFIALALGVARKHDLPYRRMVGLALAGVGIAGFFSARFERAVPALPAIGAMLIAFVPASRALRRKDKNIATIAIGVSLVVAVVAIVRLRQ
jgi:hypothetical protein